MSYNKHFARIMDCVARYCLLQLGNSEVGVTLGLIRELLTHMSGNWLVGAGGLKTGLSCD